MTELMKMYEKTNPVTVPAFLADEYNQLKLENIALKDQLRWRPASEKPEKEGRYWVTCLWQEEDEIFYCSIEYALEKGWVADKNITVLYWLPIPPAPEGD